MPKYTTIKHSCKCCGKPFEAKVLLGYYNDFCADLDTYPHNPAVYDNVVVCPSCGYAAENIKAEPDETAVKTVESGEYQKVFKDASLPETFKKQYLNALIHEACGEFPEAALSYLRAFWAKRENEDFDGNTLTKVIDLLSDWIEKNANFTAAVILVDCARQNSEFEYAEEVISSVYGYIDDEYIKAVLNFELELIKRRDNSPHSQSEVEK